MWRPWPTFARLIRVADWPFAFKMGICPALAMVALIGLAGHGIQATGNQAGLVRTVVDQDLHRADVSRPVRHTCSRSMAGCIG